MVEFFYIVEESGPESDVGEESLLEGEVGLFCWSPEEGGGEVVVIWKFIVVGIVVLGLILG